MANKVVVSIARRRLEDRLAKLVFRKQTDLAMTREERQAINKSIALCEKCLASGEVLDAFIERLDGRTLH